MISAIIHKMFHRPLLALMKTQRKQRNQELHILNKNPTHTKKNAIYAVNHSCQYDFPIASEVIDVHTYVLVGKQKLELMDRIGFLLNGVIWVDRDSRVGKKQTYQKMLLCLKRGFNMCMFPEGTWNLTPSKPLIPMYWGIIDLAKQSGCPIVPLVLEFQGNICYAKFGERIYCLPEADKQDKFDKLTDVMATLKWEIWEQCPVVSRSTLRVDEWDKEVKKRLAEYPKLDYEFEKRFVRSNLKN